MRALQSDVERTYEALVQMQRLPVADVQAARTVRVALEMALRRQLLAAVHAGFTHAQRCLPGLRAVELRWMSSSVYGAVPHVRVDALHGTWGVHGLRDDVDPAARSAVLAFTHALRLLPPDAWVAAVMGEGCHSGRAQISHAGVQLRTLGPHRTTL